jgi:hypothetical protein
MASFVNTPVHAASFWTFGRNTIGTCFQTQLHAGFKYVLCHARVYSAFESGL